MINPHIALCLSGPHQIHPDHLFASHINSDLTTYLPYLILNLSGQSGNSEFDISYIIQLPIRKLKCIFQYCNMTFANQQLPLSPYPNIPRFPTGWRPTHVMTQEICEWKKNSNFLKKKVYKLDIPVNFLLRLDGMLVSCLNSKSLD